MTTPENDNGAAVGLHALVRPGERLLIAITLPEELDESDACHPDIILDDFLASRNDGSWKVEVYSILPNNPHHPRSEAELDGCDGSTF